MELYAAEEMRKWILLSCRRQLVQMIESATANVSNWVTSNSSLSISLTFPHPTFSPLTSPDGSDSQLAKGKRFHFFKLYTSI